MSSAFAPRGTQLQRGTGALPGSGFVTIAEVIKIDRTGSKADLADVTNMDSPSGAREKLATLFEAGEISIECNFLPAASSQHLLEADFEAQQLSPYQIILPNSLGTWGPFNAFVTSNDFALPIDKQGTRTIKLTITGVPTATV
jgi:predicted secreted protein